MEQRPAAQERALDDVLRMSASYVAAFRQQWSGIVAEETYFQEIRNTSRIGDSVAAQIRRLRSDLLLVKLPDANRYVELRDVYEVDGKPIRDRQARLERLLKDPAAADPIAAIIDESARYNIGRIQRNINTPVMALQFLEAGNQQRFRFTHVPKAVTPVFTHEQDRAANDTAVFRTTTEMWTLEYEERDRPTIVRKLDRGSLPARGRFWINPSDGSVLISEVIFDGGGVIATVTVSYQSEPLMGFLVPVEMRESYLRNPERITGHAQYSRFRPIN